MIDYKQIENDKSETKYYVYVWRRPDKPKDHSIFYVGKGCKNRYRSMTNERLKNKHLKHVIAKVGWENVQKEIIEYNLSNLEAYEREKYYIALFKQQGNTLVNLTDGGDGAKGWYESLTEEEKEIHRSYSCSFSGKQHTDETKKKMSETAKGHIVSDETKNKISETRRQKFASGELESYWKGKALSKSTRSKISETRKQRIANGHIKSATTKMVIVYNLQTDTYTLYESRKQCHEVLKFDLTTALKNTKKGKPHLDKYFVYDYDDWKTQQTIENIAIEKYNGE